MSNIDVVQSCQGTETIDSDSLEPLYVLHSKLKFEWQPIFSTFSNFFKKKKIIKAILCNFSMRTLKCFLKKFKFFFALKKLKKPPSKVAQNNSNPLFFHYCLSCPNSPNRRIRAPKCGLQTNYVQNWVSTMQAQPKISSTKGLFVMAIAPTSHYTF